MTLQPSEERRRWPNEVRDEVLARLIALNAKRAAMAFVERGK